MKNSILQSSVSIHVQTPKAWLKQFY